MSELVEVWRGGVNAWECDENGHMNTRFYVHRACEGLVMLFARCGLPGLYAPAAPTTPVIRDMHIRFHREALLAAPLRMRGGFFAHDEARAQAVLVMEDLRSGEVKATFRIALDHADSADATTLHPWPAGFDPVRVAVPDNALPRGTADGPVESAADINRAQGLMCIAAGAIGTEKLDAFGRMAAPGFIGAVSDGIRSLTAPLREIVSRTTATPVEQMGGAVVEFRVLHLDWPRAGDVFEIRSGLASVDGHVKSLIHWMLNPVSGQIYGSMQSIALDFDLGKRAMIKLTPETRAELQAHVVPGLTL
ncbi:acyl-CoA thioesterase [Rhodobacter sp. NTK016B]|uniref:acyl-CoA thioesterase n=1 Tax=Rhodobacter sp. NTK016B TaxID=2759676 RepID=UPI001A8FB109|nr:thioesterase family protein [Rhodobacter sp. NTK016B]MBN8293269.1 acyl-CoA thioesterase [Rhodobacter sp. NTK016B]